MWPGVGGGKGSRRSRCGTVTRLVVVGIRVQADFTGSGAMCLGRADVAAVGIPTVAAVARGVDSTRRVNPALLAETAAAATAPPAARAQAVAAR